MSKLFLMKKTKLEKSIREKDNENERLHQSVEILTQKQTTFSLTKEQEDGVALKKKLDEAILLNSKLAAEIATWRDKWKQLENSSSSKEMQYHQEITNFKLQLKEESEKMNQLNIEKTKLEGYLRTAKQIIQEERIKKEESSNANQEIYVSAVEEKEKEIAQLKAQMNEFKENATRESKLMSGSLVELGLELQRVKGPKSDEITFATQPKSLLAQKRRERLSVDNLNTTFQK